MTKKFEEKIVKSMQQGLWINKEKVITNNLDKEKPCHKLGYCPYGAIVEMFPLKIKSNKLSCKTFGHDCPMYYNAEDITE